MTLLNPFLILLMNHLLILQHPLLHVHHHHLHDIICHASISISSCRKGGVCGWARDGLDAATRIRDGWQINDTIRILGWDISILGWDLGWDVCILGWVLFTFIIIIIIIIIISVHCLTTLG